jgi:hypothetical protein
MTTHLTSRIQLRALGLTALRKLAEKNGVAARLDGVWVPKAELVDELARRLLHVGRDGAWVPGDVPAH